ncbi:gfrp-1 [Pristionchus pacificus]|uniref:GTP cyclohydrolase 1 feedback regulatory protein n=2 Tax=Pristionchus pacificus TaxID=54126 RepID=A0A2A6BID8_PRIPA|nr:gfrp-1 [Pristionchus pacificus]|eukprot:PDM65598.1 gfrp-1 [Pristionchus pacificus]
MPHLLISTQMRLECGPTFVGDKDSDEELMEYLQASPRQQLGQSFVEYATDLSPRAVLDLLETRGWTVVSMCGIGKLP